MTLLKVIQPEQMAAALNRVAAISPRTREKEGEFRVLASMVNTEGVDNSDIRLCALNPWAGGSVKVISGALPMIIPEQLTLKPGIEYRNPFGGQAVFTIHHNGTLHVVNIETPEPYLLAV